MINIDVETFKSEVMKLDAAKNVFKSYSDNFIGDTYCNLDDCKSDFIYEIQETLFNMRDTKAPNLMEKLNTFHEKLKIVVEDFENLDEELANYFDINIDGTGDKNV